MYKKIISTITSLFILIFNILCNINIKSYTPEKQIEILDNLGQELTSEKYPILFKNVNTTQSVYIIGDLHGDLYSFEAIKEIISENISKDLFVFLGDYIDHGENSVEVFMKLAELKIEFPDNIILLAGNHERLHDQIHHVLYKHTLKSQLEENPELYKKYCNIFKLLPLGVVLKLHDDKKIFCVHGGLPMTGYDALRSEFVKYVKYIYNPSESETEPDFPSDFEMQLLWNDPKIPGVREHKDTYVHTKEIAKEYMKELGWSYIFRGHQYVEKGYRKDFDGINEFTVFSSCNKEASDHTKAKKPSEPTKAEETSEPTAAIVKIMPESHACKVATFNHETKEVVFKDLEEIKQTNQNETEQTQPVENI